MRRRPKWERLPIGCGLQTTDADAVLLIGDRAIAKEEDGERRWDGNRESSEPLSGEFVEVWDLGQRWSEWTGLPFVFAMWIARPSAEAGEVATVLGAAHDEGVQHLAEIAEREAPLIGISRELAIQYLHDNLHFVLGDSERAGLRKFYGLCVSHGLAPSGLSTAVQGARVS